jgi:hypothetical protein
LCVGRLHGSISYVIPAACRCPPRWP